MDYVDMPHDVLAERLERCVEDRNQALARRDLVMAIMAEQAEDIIGLKAKDSALSARVLELEAQRALLLIAKAKGEER